MLPSTTTTDEYFSSTRSIPIIETIIGSRQKISGKNE